MLPPPPNFIDTKQISNTTGQQPAKQFNTIVSAILAIAQKNENLNSSNRHKDSSINYIQL